MISNGAEMSTLHSPLRGPASGLRKSPQRFNARYTFSGPAIGGLPGANTRHTLSDERCRDCTFIRVDIRLWSTLVGLLSLRSLLARSVPGQPRFRSKYYADLTS